MDSLPSRLFCLFATANLWIGEALAKEYCGSHEGKEYFCDEGQCCGDFDCCNYFKYYKAWWFWLVWAVISTLGCCCAYQRRRHYGWHGHIRNFIYPLAPARTEDQPLTPYEEFFSYPKYNLPSYAEVEAMGSLGPPSDVENAPPPYADPLANENLEDDADNFQNGEIFLQSEGDHESSTPLIPPDTEEQTSENS